MDTNSAQKLPSTSKLLSLNKNCDKGQPKRFCVNCRNHHIKIPITGHKKNCLYKHCLCEYCALTNHVKIVSLKERKIHRQISREAEKISELLITQTDEKPKKAENETKQDFDELFYSEGNSFTGDLYHVGDFLPTSFPETTPPFHFNPYPSDNSLSYFDDLQLEQVNEVEEKFDWTQYLNWTESKTSL